MPDTTAVITSRIPLEQATQLREIAAEHDSNVSHLVRALVRRALVIRPNDSDGTGDAR